jgi:arsenate reductase (glutaredoxin)
VDLLKTPPTAAQLADLCRKLGVAPREILRKKDPAYAEHGLDTAKLSDAKLLELMAANPGLIQRPIVVKGKRAVLARPVETIDALVG